MRARLLRGGSLRLGETSGLCDEALGPYVRRCRSLRVVLD